MQTNKTLESLIRRNKIHSDFYKMCEGARKKYIALHRTLVFFLGCMDGRVNPLNMCGLPAGVAYVLKQRGGVFSLSYNYFGKTIMNWYEKAIESGRSTLGFVSYHFNKSSEDLGCAGHENDTNRAILALQSVVEEFGRVYDDKSVFDTVLVGIETGKSGFVFHGRNVGDTYSISENLNHSEDQIEEELRKLYPDMDREIFRDMLAYAVGNHNMLIKNGGSLHDHDQIDHEERVVAFGKGHEFIFQTTGKDGDVPMSNFCLSVGPYNKHFVDEIKTSFNVLKGNVLKRGMNTEDGFVLLSSAEYENHVRKNWALEKIRGYTSDALAVFNSEEMKEVRELLAPHMILVEAIVDSKTRVMTIIRKTRLGGEASEINGNSVSHNKEAVSVN